MRENLINSIRDENFRNTMYVDEFISAYKTKLNVSDDISSFKKLIRSFMNNDFEIRCLCKKNKSSYCMTMSTKGNILLEHDILIRTAIYYDQLQAITDSYFGKQRRYVGIEIILGMISEHKLMQYLIYHEADVYEVIVLLNVIGKFIEGNEAIELWSAMQDIPASHGMLILKKMHAGESCLNELLDINKCLFNRSSFSLSTGFYHWLE